ncbi:MAG: ABC transporter ATP-binding protein [Bacteroidota bacterium]
MSEAAKRSGNIFDAKVLRRLMAFAKPYRYRFYSIILLTLLLGALAPYRVMLVDVTVDKYISVRDWPGLLRMTLFMTVLLIAQSVAQYIYTYQSSWLGQTIIRDIRIRLYDHVLGLRLKFFDQTQVGRLITRNISDIETLSDVFTEGLAAMAGDIIQLVFIVGFMLYTDWRLTLVSLSMFPLLLISTYIFKEGIKSSFNSVRAAVANMNAFVQEHITGMTVVQFFAAEQRELKRFTALNTEHRDANIKSVWYYSIYFPVAEVIGAAGTGLLVWYGAQGVLQDKVTLGNLIAFIMYIGMFFRPIRTIADRFNTLQSGIVSADRIFNLLDNNETTVDTGTLTPAHLKGDIEFKDVWFAYTDEDWVLKDVNFRVPAGQTVALVGATGAGKSSVINLLNRFYNISQGQILLDGKSVDDYRLTWLRHRIGIVLQDVFLFSGSIEYNITLGNPEITREQVERAAHLVGAMDFIEKLPGGLDYNVKERGATLSVGQRQLISFVRAMVYDPAVIILDEATSSVDTETEEMIQRAIDKMMAGRTAVVIAHRLSTIRKADSIILLDKGRIMEQGTHDELLSLEEGMYAKLHKAQYREMV